MASLRKKETMDSGFHRSSLSKGAIKTSCLERLAVEGDLTGALVKLPFIGHPHCHPDKARPVPTPHGIRARTVDPACLVAPLPGWLPHPGRGLGSRGPRGPPSYPLTSSWSLFSPKEPHPPAKGVECPQALCQGRSLARAARRRQPPVHPSSTWALLPRPLITSSAQSRAGPLPTRERETHRVTSDHLGEEPCQAVIGEEAVGASQVQALSRGRHAPGGHHGGRVGNELHVCGTGRQRGKGVE